MSRPAVDLAQCASEPIRVPGAIQPHGWLVSLALPAGRVAAYSANCGELLGAPAQALPDGLQPALDALRLPLATLVEGSAPVSLGTVVLGGRALHVAAHRIGALAHLEFEPDAGDPGTQAPLYAVARHLLPLMQQAGGVPALCELAAREMKRLTGFGRCLVYRFDAEGHGAVLAECGDPGYRSYAGHHFPASDIPPQARELYRVNRIRLIPDANYQPVPLVFVDPALDGAALDLSHAGLRSVSPVHLEYMRNMGTPASMSVSIVVRGALWGLVSCHDHAPRHLPFPTRMACEHLGQLLSLQIEAKEDNAHVSEQLELRQLTLAMVAHLADSDATLQRLVDEPVPLLRLGRAAGAAVILDERCWTAGACPPAAQLLQLGQWLAGGVEPVFHTDRLGAVAPALQALGPVATGVLAISISQVHRHHIVWFRPEIEQTVDWAGDPRKEASADATGRLHPRRSFDTWRELVRGCSLPWRPAEVAAALELRQALIGIVLRRAEEMAEVATELGRVNKELEAFSYTVSHDLRAPMRHIAGYADLVLETEGERLTDRARRYLRHVKEAAAYAGELVDALLDFSRMGRSALKHTHVDTRVLVHDLVAELNAGCAGRRIEWTLDPALPVLWGDAVLLQVAVRNLLGNAVKYTRTRDAAAIHVEALTGAAGDGLAVRDNGVGFPMKYADKLFGVFQRLHPAEAFEGTGIGLASVRRIVERHGGAVFAEGEPERGARFAFILPRRDTRGASH